MKGYVLGCCVLHQLRALDRRKIRRNRIPKFGRDDDSSNQTELAKIGVVLPLLQNFDAVRQKLAEGG
jgi:hypothetical protein